MLLAVNRSFAEGRLADHDQEPHAGKLERLNVRFCGFGWLRIIRFLFFGSRVVSGSCDDVHVSCEDRINLYPAAPIRLATMLNAWTIAEVGWG